MSSGDAPSRKTLTKTHGKVIFGLEAIGIAALPSEPIITRNTMINSVVLNLPTAVETIPIIYRDTEFTSSPSLTKPCPATTMLASSGKPVTHAPATVSIKIWTV